MSAEREAFAVFGFEGTHEAIRAEEVLIAAEVDVVLIPTPRALGSLCGFAVRVPIAERASALEALKASGLEPGGEVEMRDRVSRRR
ncbi:MAG: DUF3343 domain-containing protein [Coriobacteriia bacterium]|nr:DUF3343 domain-containing protein [Coriobacteriia bacterium]